MIGVFDSGVGGVSILQEIQKRLPEENYIYLADKAFFPYGDKSQKQVKRRTKDVVAWFRQQNTKLLVVACNTATVAALDELRDAYPDMPIVGTVPVIKTCAERTQNGNIGILTTMRTARSKYQDALIRRFAKDKHVFVQAAPGLVQAIEEGKGNIAKNKRLVRPLQNLRNRGIDTLALGCSHFPLVQKEIRKVSGDTITVLDSGAAIARQTERVLRAEGLLSQKTGSSSAAFYTTGDAQKFDIILSRYISQDVVSQKVDMT